MNWSTAHHRNRRNNGFTILELIVAVAVSSLMLTLIGFLFFSTSNAVSLSVAVSDVIGTARAASHQIHRDAQAMLPPATDPGSASSGGVLVIVCQKQTNVPYYGLNMKGGKTRDLRVDQVWWLRDIDKSGNGPGALPITPKGDATFTPATATDLASMTAIRVWYGHVIKTNPDGTNPSNPAIGADGPNKYATHLVLGRQALVLTNDSPAISAIAHVQGVQYNSPVAGLSAPGTVPAVQYMGLCDVANYSWQNVAHPVGALVGLKGSGALLEATDGANPTYGNNGTYQQNALSVAFVTERLRANPAPEYDPANPPATPFAAWQVAQMHPIYAMNVSDIIIDFAADTSFVDNTGPGGVGPPDGKDDDPSVDTEMVNGNTVIRWYGFDDQPNYGALPAPKYDPHIVPAGGGHAYVFRHDGPKMWPYLVRIRYRIHDKRGNLLGKTGPEPQKTNSGKWFEQIIKVKREPTS